MNKDLNGDLLGQASSKYSKNSNKARGYAPIPLQFAVDHWILASGIIPSFRAIPPERWHNTLFVLYFRIFPVSSPYSCFFLIFFLTLSFLLCLCLDSSFDHVLVPARSAIFIFQFWYHTFRIFHRNFVMPVADVTTKTWRQLISFSENFPTQYSLYMLNTKNV